MKQAQIKSAGDEIAMVNTVIQEAHAGVYYPCKKVIYEEPDSLQKLILN